MNHSEHKTRMYHIRSVLALSLPMAWSRFIQIFGWFLGMLMVAHLDKTVLAASALLNAVQITVSLIFMSIIFAVGVIAARLYGEEKHQEIGVLFQQALLLGIFFGCCMMLVFYFSGDLLLLMKQPPELVQVVRQYFHALIWASLPIMLLTVIQQLCYGMSKQKLVVYNNLLSLFFLIPCCYVLIYGKYGFPAFGIEGLAYAIALQCLLNIVTLLTCLARDAVCKRYQLFQRHQHRSLHYAKQLFQIGWPMSVQFGGELLALSVLAIFTGWLGVAALSATQITQQLFYLFLVPLFAIAEASGIFVSQLVGAKRFQELRVVGNVCIFLGVSLTCLLGLILVFFPKYLTAMYINVNDPANASIVELSRWLFYLTAPMLLMETLRNLYAGVLRGFYDTQVPMWVGLCSVWMIALPLAYLLGFTAHWGVLGVRSATLVGFFVGALVLCWRWQLKSKAACYCHNAENGSR